MVRAMLAAGQFYAVPLVTYAYRKEHRPLPWEAEQTRDLFAGLAEVWQLAQEQQLPELQQAVHANLCDHYARIRRHLTAGQNAFIREVESATGHRTLSPFLEPDNRLLRFLRRLFIKKTPRGTTYRILGCPVLRVKCTEQ